MGKHKNKHITFLLFCFFLMSSTVEADTCESWVALAISVQGSAEQRVVKDGQETWQSIQLGHTFCTKDILRVRENSRVALILNNDTVVRLDENTTITFSNLSPDNDSTLDLKAGIAHFISRVKQAFKVITPFVNAAVEGTEFVVAVEPEQAQVTVFEGVVKAENEKGHVRLTQGQTAVALKDQAPVLKTMVKPRDAVQWALYYPTILKDSDIDPKLPPEVRDKLAQSMMLNGQGKTTDALNILEALPDDLANADVYSYRAALRLAVGRITKANQDIEQALGISAKNSNALALKSIIAVVENRAKDAESLAQQAVKSNPKNASAYLALSYSKQAQFDLNGAQQAIDNAPDDAMIDSRRAELHLAQGDLVAALDAANKAVSKNPDSSHTQTVLGFTHLIRLDIVNARQTFNQAIKLEQTNPLSHLGLGLAMIRDGDIERGRREMEYAASLDPNYSLIRSYLGKAYYEEGRNKVAANQFDMAKTLDPNDPTPWFYDAIRKQNQNDAVGALTDLENSIARNGNRIVYRSQLKLDQDNASRGANVGKIYSELGFEQMAIQEAAKSLTDDPTNHSAHRFLADMYLSLPRHEIATTSEILQAQLTQPINTAPANQRLSNGNMGIIEEGKSLNIGYGEYTSLFEHNRNNINVSALSGGNETEYYDVNYFGVYNNLSLSASIFDYNTEGYRLNNDQDDALKNALIQYALSPHLTIHFEFQERESRNGDIIQRFGDNNFDPNLREKFDVISERVGINYSPSSSHSILFSHLDSKRDFFQATNDGFFFDEYSSGSDGTSTELQYIFTNSAYNVIAGTGYSKQDAYSAWYTDFGMGMLPNFDNEFKIRHENAYIYSPVRIDNSHTLIFAASYDFIETSSIKKNKTNPKVGYIYNDINGITFRLAAFKTLKRPILSNQTLEPTQIAGFNQFFDENNGAEATRYGLGLDKKFSRSMFSGIEFSKREADQPLANNNIHEISENIHRAYFNWLPNNSLSMSVELLYEDWGGEFSLTFGDPKEPASYETYSIPVTLKYFHKNYFYGFWRTSYVKQKIAFEDDLTFELTEFDDEFSITDIMLGSKFSVPSTDIKGELTLGVKNVFDENFNFHNTNSFSALPRPLTYYPERYSYGKIQLFF